jgi:hypothetical protein
MTDLSGYYIIKKYNHGWQLGIIGTNDSEFFSREKLVDMGYLSGTEEESNASILGTTPPIIVPTGLSLVEPKKRLKQNNNKQKSKHRADNDPNWRKSKDKV